MSTETERARSATSKAYITIQTPSGRKHVGRRIGGAGEYYFELPSPSAPNGEWWTLNPQTGFVSVPSNSRALRAAIDTEHTAALETAAKAALGGEEDAHVS